MARKKKQNNSADPTNEIVKKVKSLMLETIVREWLNTRVKEWGNKTPLEMIKKGEGQKILDALDSTDEELKKERNGSNGNDQTRDRNVEESVSEENHILSRV